MYLNDKSSIYNDSIVVYALILSYDNIDIRNCLLKACPNVDIRYVKKQLR